MLTQPMFCYHCGTMTAHHSEAQNQDHVKYTCVTCQHGETLPEFERFGPDEPSVRTDREPIRR